jgi:uncharacterized protein YciW
MIVVPGDSKISAALAIRADVVKMTNAAMAAVLSPEEPGAFSHGIRAALAARIATLYGSEPLVDAFERRLCDQTVEPDVTKLADPAYDGGDDPYWQAVLAFTDRVTSRPRDATADDIESLREAGLAEADIVRLAQLNAFLAYHFRLAVGMRLMVTSI